MQAANLLINVGFLFQLRNFDIAHFDFYNCRFVEQQIPSLVYHSERPPCQKFVDTEKFNVFMGKIYCVAFGETVVTFDFGFSLGFSLSHLKNISIRCHFEIFASEELLGKKNVLWRRKVAPESQNQSQLSAYSQKARIIDTGQI